MSYELNPPRRTPVIPLLAEAFDATSAVIR